MGSNVPAWTRLPVVSHAVRSAVCSAVFDQAGAGDRFPRLASSVYDLLLLSPISI